MRSCPSLLRAHSFFLLGFLTVSIALPVYSFASAYNGHPKLVVVIVIDQFRGDYLERYRDQFGDAGFRSPARSRRVLSQLQLQLRQHAHRSRTLNLFTGAYSNGHGIADNEWWDPKKKKMVTSVEDDDTKLVGIAGAQAGASPHNLLADTIGDELKLATQGKARVFGVSLKDRAAVLPAGFAGDAAYWIDPKTGAWITSTYYATISRNGRRISTPVVPQNIGIREWKDAQGTGLRSTAHRKKEKMDRMPVSTK